MAIFADYLTKIETPEHRERMEEILQWVGDRFPNLEPRIAWNQPMFTDHGTFIIGFSVSKQHVAVAPEAKGIMHFSNDIVEAGYRHTTQIMRIPWSRPVPYELLEKMIEFNIEDKADCTTFWRKENGS